MSNIFHFSVSVIELEFQHVIGFHAQHFFFPFIRKLTQMHILTVFSNTVSGLAEKAKTTNRKTANTFLFFLCKNKNAIFSHLRSKMTTE